MGHVVAIGIVIRMVKQHVIVRGVGACIRGAAIQTNNTACATLACHLGTHENKYIKSMQCDTVSGIPVQH